MSVSPVTVTDLHDAIATDQAYTHTCALRASGNVSCWGQAGFDGSSTTSGDGGIAYDLKPMNAAAGIRSVTLGWYHSCALHSDYTVTCWQNTMRISVPGVTSAVAMASDANRNCVALRDGTVNCFGATGVAETVPSIVLW